jgi:hypothetical protein
MWWTLLQDFVEQSDLQTHHLSDILNIVYMRDSLMRSSATHVSRGFAFIFMLSTLFSGARADSLPPGTGCLLSSSTLGGTTTVTVSFARTMDGASEIVETRTLKNGIVNIVGKERGVIPKYCAEMVRESILHSDAMQLLSAK